jgi:uncharacterized protein (TIGR02217 family)
MSSTPFPVFPGQGWSVYKKPRFNTLVQTAASGRELRAATFRNAVYDFQLTFPVLRDDSTQEFRTMLEFFLARQGSFDEFLLTDPTDCSVTNQYLGAADGFTQIFRLQRTVLSTITEPVGALNAMGTVTAGPTAQSAGSTFTYTGVAGYSGANAIEFGAAPPYGYNVYASFSYYFRVRFKDDAANFENFANKLWTWGQVDLMGIAP